MKLKLVLFFVLLVAAPLWASAQDYAFKVLASKGSNTVDNAPLKIGAKLKDSQTIKVASDSYLSLAHHSGKALEVAPGTHKIKELEAKVAQSTSVNSKYADFVIKELTQSDEGVAAAKNRFQHMNKTGSVVRDMSLIATMLPVNTRMFGNQLVVRWYMKDNSDANGEGNYKIMISDLSDNVIFTQQTQSTATTIDISKDPKLAEQQQLIVKVVPLDKDGKERISAQAIVGNAIMRMSSEEMKELQNELQNITSKNQAPSALTKLIEARFFEEKELYADAIYAYEKAIELSDGTEQYKRIYEFFLDRNGLSKEARMGEGESSNK